MAAKGKILVVDDDPDFVRNNSDDSSIGWYEVATAGDGRKRLRKTREVLPDLILPRCDGGESFRGVQLYGKSQDGS